MGRKYNLGHVKGSQGDQGIQGIQGKQGIQGIQGPAGTIQVGAVYALPSGDTPRVENVGTTQAAILDFYLPIGLTGGKGDKGDPGQNATIQVGTVTMAAPGTSPSILNSGTATAAVLDFVLPKGDTGVGIVKLERTKGDGSPGSTDTYSFKLTDGSTQSFDVYQGRDGAGDMTKTVYDPQGKATDIFEYINTELKKITDKYDGILANVFRVQPEGGN